jgi:hypothetical protein
MVTIATLKKNLGVSFKCNKKENENEMQQKKLKTETGAHHEKKT